MEDNDEKKPQARWRKTLGEPLPLHEMSRKTTTTRLRKELDAARKEAANDEEVVWAAVRKGVQKESRDAKVDRVL